MKFSGPDIEKRIKKITKEQWIEIFFFLFREIYGRYKRDYEVTTGAEDFLDYIKENGHEEEFI